MITEAEIQSIDYSSNTCVIRIPLFESAASNLQTIITANLAITPGIYNSYLAGDLVWVGFERNKPENPVIIGKIYQGGTIESKVVGGAINCTDLAVSNSAKIPSGTTLSGAATDYNTIDKLINKIRTLETDIEVIHSYYLYIGVTLSDGSTGNICVKTMNSYQTSALFMQQLNRVGVTDSQPYPIEYFISSVSTEYVGITTDGEYLYLISNLGEKKQITVSTFSCINNCVL